MGRPARRKCILKLYDVDFNSEVHNRIVNTVIFKKDVPKKRNSNTISILGCSSVLVDDIREFGVKGDVMALSDTIAYYPGRIDHAFSRHARALMPPLLELRRFRCRDVGFITHTWGGFERIPQEDVVWNLNKTPKGTGMMAIFISLAWGYDYVRLLGMPHDTSPHFYDVMPSAKWKPDDFIPEFSVHGDLIAPYVRSASGRTREYIGGLEDWRVED